MRGLKAIVLAVGLLAIVGLASPDVRDLFRPAASWWETRNNYPIQSMHIDGRYIEQLCADKRDFAKTMCDGFISAVAEVMAKGPVQGLTACVPPILAPADVLAFVREQLERAEVSVDRSGSWAVAKALKDAFPCQPTSSRRRQEIYLHTGELQQECAASKDDSRLVCEGFVLAVADMLGFGPVHGIEACFPHLQDAIYTKVRKGLSAPPVRWDEPLWPASRTVARILAAPHLCPR